MTSPNAIVTKLKLTHNYLSNVGINQLSISLMNENTKLTSLFVDKSPVIRTLPTCLQSNGLISLGNSLSNMKYLHTINIY